MEIDERIKKSSENALWAIKLLFALVLAKGLVMYKEIVLNPFLPQNRLAAAGLLVIYLTTLLSWIDFSDTMDANPYIFSRKWKKIRWFEKFRFGVDIFIVFLYAYLLFSVESFQKDPEANIHKYLLGFAGVFFLYYISGVVRVLVHGWRASRRLLIFGIFVVFVLIMGVYSKCYLYDWVPKMLLNYMAVICCGITIIVHRLVRNHIIVRSDRQKEEGMRIGIDVDGVLGNQIVGLLPIIGEKYGKKLKYEDVNDWNLPVNDTNIAKIIEEAQEDESYILEMPLHANARKVVEKIERANNIIIITSRPKVHDDLTKRWLFLNKIPYDKYFNAMNSFKSKYRVNLLIDDYIENIKEFLNTTNGIAILFNQPWNQNRDELAKWYEDNRLFTANDWNDVFNLTKEIRAS